MRGDAARMLSDDGVTPEVGGVYTVSRDFTCGDGSWNDCFWEVLSISGPNVLIQIHGRYETFKRIFRIEERAWYPADEAFAIFKKAESDD